MTERVKCPKCEYELQNNTDKCPNCKQIVLTKTEDSKIRNYTQKIKSKLKETNTIIFLVGSLASLILAILFIVDGIDSMMGGGPFDSLLIKAGILIGFCIIMTILGLRFVQRIIAK